MDRRAILLLFLVGGAHSMMPGHHSEPMKLVYLAGNANSTMSGQSSEAMKLVYPAGNAKSMMSGQSSETMPSVYPAEGLHAPPGKGKKMRRIIRRLGRTMVATVRRGRQRLKAKAAAKNLPEDIQKLEGAIKLAESKKQNIVKIGQKTISIDVAAEELAKLQAALQKETEKRFLPDKCDHDSKRACCCSGGNCNMDKKVALIGKNHSRNLEIWTCAGVCQGQFPFANKDCDKLAKAEYKNLPAKIESKKEAVERAKGKKEISIWDQDGNKNIGLKEAEKNIGNLEKQLKALEEVPEIKKIEDAKAQEETDRIEKDKAQKELDRIEKDKAELDRIEQARIKKEQEAEKDRIEQERKDRIKQVRKDRIERKEKAKKEQEEKRKEAHRRHQERLVQIKKGEGSKNFSEHRANKRKEKEELDRLELERQKKTKAKFRKLVTDTVKRHAYVKKYIAENIVERKKIRDDEVKKHIGKKIGHEVERKRMRDDEVKKHISNKIGGEVEERRKRMRDQFKKNINKQIERHRERVERNAGVAAAGLEGGDGCPWGSRLITEREDCKSWIKKNLWEEKKPGFTTGEVIKVIRRPSGEVIKNLPGGVQGPWCTAWQPHWVWKGLYYATEESQVLICMNVDPWGPHPGNVVRLETGDVLKDLWLVGATPTKDAQGRKMYTPNRRAINTPANCRAATGLVAKTKRLHVDNEKGPMELHYFRCQYAASQEEKGWEWSMCAVEGVEDEELDSVEETALKRGGKMEPPKIYPPRKVTVKSVRVWFFHPMKWCSPNDEGYDEYPCSFCKGDGTAFPGDAAKAEAKEDGANNETLKQKRQDNAYRYYEKGPEKVDQRVDLGPARANVLLLGSAHDPGAELGGSGFVLTEANDKKAKHVTRKEREDENGSQDGEGPQGGVDSQGGEGSQVGEEIAPKDDYVRDFMEYDGYKSGNRSKVYGN